MKEAEVVVHACAGMEGQGEPRLLQLAPVSHSRRHRRRRYASSLSPLLLFRLQFLNLVFPPTARTLGFINMSIPAHGAQMPGTFYPSPNRNPNRHKHRPQTRVTGDHFGRHPVGAPPLNTKGNC